MFKNFKNNYIFCFVHRIPKFSLEIVDGEEKNTLVTVNFKEGQRIRFFGKDDDFSSKHYDIRYEFDIIEGKFVVSEMKNFERVKRNEENKKDEVDGREEGEIVSDEEDEKDGEEEEDGERSGEGSDFGKKDDVIVEIEGENKIEVDEEKVEKIEDEGNRSGGENEIGTDEENLDTSGSMDSEVIKMGEDLEKKLNEENVGVVEENLGGGLNVVEERKVNEHEELKDVGIKERVNPGKNENVRKRKMTWRFEQGEGSGIGNSGAGKVEDVLKEIMKFDNGSPHREKKR